MYMDWAIWGDCATMGVLHLDWNPLTEPIVIETVVTHETIVEVPSVYTLCNPYNSEGDKCFYDATPAGSSTNWFDFNQCMNLTCTSQAPIADALSAECYSIIYLANGGLVDWPLWGECVTTKQLGIDWTVEVEPVIHEIIVEKEVIVEVPVYYAMCAPSNAQGNQCKMVSYDFTGDINWTTFNTCFADVCPSQADDTTNQISADCYASCINDWALYGECVTALSLGITWNAPGTPVVEVEVVTPEGNVEVIDTPVIVNPLIIVPEPTADPVEPNASVNPDSTDCAPSQTQGDLCLQLSLSNWGVVNWVSFNTCIGQVCPNQAS